MLKFTYILFLAFTSLILFLFSKDKTIVTCANEVNGAVSLITDSTGSYLGIITDKNILLHPTSMNEEIVLAAGQKVTICYKVDSSNIAGNQSPLPIHIQTISYHR